MGVGVDAHMGVRVGAHLGIHGAQSPFFLLNPAFAKTSNVIFECAVSKPLRCLVAMTSMLKASLLR